MIVSKETKYNLAIYFALLLIATITVFYGNSLLTDYTSLRLWKYSNVLILLVGLPFIFLQRNAKLPSFLQNDIPGKYRFFIPLIIGAVFGILDILVFKVILHPQPYIELPPFTQPFPYSILLYLSGAFEVEVFYRLIPLTIILLIGNWYKGGKYYLTFFLTAAILTALREPLEQLSQGGILLLIYGFISGFLMNFLQAVWYGRAGFLASLSIRLGHYLLWHILLGLYIERIELA